MSVLDFLFLHQKIVNHFFDFRTGLPDGFYFFVQFCQHAGVDGLVLLAELGEAFGEFVDVS